MRGERITSTIRTADKKLVAPFYGLSYVKNVLLLKLLPPYPVPIFTVAIPAKPAYLDSFRAESGVCSVKVVYVAKGYHFTG